MIRKFRNFDYLSFAVMLLLMAIGTTAIWSAGAARAEAVFHGMWRQTLMTGVVGLGLYMALALVDYRRYLDFLSVPAYAGALVCLVAVLLFGSTVYGGRRWLWFFQPSEVSKLAVLMFMSAVYGGIWGARLRGFVGFALGMAILGIPALLILAEPDLGTTLTLVPAAVLLLFAAGVWRKGLITIVAVGGIAALTVLGAVYEAKRSGVSQARSEEILKYVPLRPHQLQRVEVFLFPERNCRDAGYNLIQAKISIGSGGLRGKGLGKGESNHLKYLPQAISMNDFIFCVWAEETGYIGSLTLLVLFGLLLFGGCRAAFLADDLRGRLLALGVTALLFAHVYVNIAMSIGLVPITGLPLPFISSGRTFLVTVLMGLGLIQSIVIHREENE